jgi:hypothetical protein
MPQTRMADNNEPQRSLVGLGYQDLLAEKKSRKLSELAVVARRSNEGGETLMPRQPILGEVKCA